LIHIGEMGHTNKVYRTLQKRIKIFYPYFKAWVRNFSNNEIPTKAAALSFSTVFAIVPFLALLFGLFTSIHAFDQVWLRLEEFIFQKIIPNSNENITQYLQKFTSNAGALSSFGILIMFITSLDLFIKLDNTVNRIWEITKKRTFKHSLTIFWMTVTIGPFVIAVTFFLNERIQILFSQPFVLSAGFAFLTKILSNFLIFILIFFFHTQFPNTFVNKWAAFIGTVVAMVSFEFIEFIFGKFLSHVTTWESIYGPLSVIPLLFLWIYCNWHILLISCQIVYFLTTGYMYTETQRGSSKDFYAFQILRILHESFRSGKGGMTFKELKKKLRLSEIEILKILKPLYHTHLIRNDDHQYFLGKSLERIKILQILNLYSHSTHRFPRHFHDPFSSKLLGYYKKLDRRFFTSIRGDRVSRFLS